MKVEKIIFDNEDEASMLYFYEDGSTEVKSYPPVDPKDKKLIEEFGGHYKISKETFKYNKELEILNKKWNQFLERETVIQDSFVIDSILAADLTKEQTMQIKMSIFKEDKVKSCKNTKLLTSLRKANDIIDIMMYYGMIKNDISNWS